MKLLSFNLGSILGKTALATAALGFLLAAGAPAAKANDRDDCNRRIAYTQQRYRGAVERFGPRSSQAHRWAQERREALKCRENFRHDYRR